VKDTIRQIDIAGYPFSVEVVESHEKRAKGLMDRKYLHNGTGMLFKMDGGPAQFHMKNTLIPLDILYLDDNGTILKKDQMRPHIGRSQCSGDVHRVLELPAGTCDELSVGVGDVIEVDQGSIIRETVYEILLYKWKRCHKSS
tara:strand:- start:8024 stop:8449 length:426 start_codon:yes stop_codon:yes gene_type:complete